MQNLNFDTNMIKKIIRIKKEIIRFFRLVKTT